MENEIIDNKGEDFKGTYRVVPHHFKVMTVLAYIGNGIMGFFLLFLSISGLVGTKMLTGVKGESIEGWKVVLVTLTALLGLLCCIFCIIGISGMRKLKEKGWVNYSYANGLWLVLSVQWMSSTGIAPLYLIIFILSAGFFIYFRVHRKLFD